MGWPNIPPGGLGGSSPDRRWFWISLALPLCLLNGWVLLQILNYFQSPLRIFIIANLVAFILGYPVRWLRRYPRLKLPYAVTLVLLTTAIILAIIGLLVMPKLIDQIRTVLNLLPHLNSLGDKHLEDLDNLTSQWQIPTNFRVWGKELSGELPSQIRSITNQLLDLLIWTAGSLVEAGFILIMTVYLLLRGNTFWDGIFRWLPMAWRHKVRQRLRHSFQNYYIGQATVAALLGASLIIAFTIFQVPFALLFGLFVGSMAFFPFGGGTSIVLISIIAGFQNIWLGIKVLVIATVVDQIVENGLAPRLLGSFTGVHPVWILLSLMIGAKVAGILGILVAIPISSFLQDTLNDFH
jgi:predicted PurR-regulated permease PerM